MRFPFLAAVGFLGGCCKSSFAFQHTPFVIHKSATHPTTRSSFSFAGDDPISRSYQRRSQRVTKLHAIPPTAKWAVGHMIGGVLGVPTVIHSTRTNGWYRKIDLPSWTPPNAIFGPVWTLLYAMMGVAIGRIYAATNANKLLLPLWSLHFALNLLWAPVFFGKQRLRLGLIINVALVSSLAVIMPLVYQMSNVSAYLLLPYAAWLAFATVLNRAICQRNPTSHGYNDAMLQSDLWDLQQAASKYAGL
jgi:benzodiazapine receptor